MASNPYDQFDAASNPYDQFDSAPTVERKAGVRDYFTGIPETLAHLGSSAITGVAAGYSGLGTMLGNNLGITDANPADVVNSVQSAAFEPRSVGGKALTQAVTYPFRKFGEFADFAGDKTRQGVSAIGGSPEQAAQAGTTINTAINAVPMIVGAHFGKAPAITKQPKPVAPEVQSAVDAGLKLTPRQGGGLIGKATESLSNSAKLERSLSLENAKVVDAGVLRQIGLPSDTKISRATLAKAKAEPNSVYGEVAKLPPVAADDALIAAIDAIPERTGIGVRFPGNVAELKKEYLSKFQDETGARSPQQMQAMLDEVRQLRKESSAAKRGPYDPARIAEADVKRKIADALEGQIDRHIKATPDVPKDLFPRYKQAQQKLAMVESATKAAKGGHIDARLLAKQADKGVPLSGEMKAYATAFDNFDRVLQNPSKLRNTGPFDSLDAVIGAGFAWQNPAFLAAVAGRPLARNALASRAYQNSAIAGQSGFEIPYNIALIPPAVEQSRVTYDPPRLPRR